MNSSRQKTVNIWKFYQNESPQVFDKSYSRLSYLARTIKPGAKALNVGVGGGIFESIGLSMGLRVYSLDPDEETIFMLIKRFKSEERFKVGTSDNMPLKMVCSMLSLCQGYWSIFLIVNWRTLLRKFFAFWPLQGCLLAPFHARRI